MVDDNEDLDFIEDKDLEELEAKLEKAEEIAKKINQASGTATKSFEEIKRQQMAGGGKGSLPYGTGGQTSGPAVGGWFEKNMVGFKKAKQIGGGVPRIRGDRDSQAAFSHERWSEQMEQRLEELEGEMEQNRKDDVEQERLLELNQEVDEAQDMRLMELDDKINDIRRTAGKIEGGSRDIFSALGRGGANLPSFAQSRLGKVTGFLKGLGPYGIIASFAIDFAIRYGTMMYQQIMNEVKSFFAPGGLFDVRKAVKDEVVQYQSLENLINIRRGTIYFSSNSSEVLRQGVPYGNTNTQDMALGLKRYMSTHDTENW